MREIKFRLFLGGMFHYWGFIKVGSLKKALAFSGLPNTNKESVTIQELEKRSEQYIGKKDMDGTKVFAGDVIAVYPGPEWEADLGEEARFLVTQEMNFLGMQFSVDHISGYECITHIIESDDEDLWANAKVIGNIHENPELAPELLI